MADVTIVDTSPRDGPVALPKIRTPEKVALANSLMQSGSIKIDCVAFTHPRLRPEYADAEKVINALEKKIRVTVIGLAPNEIACRRALNTPVDEIGILVAGSESFNRSVLGSSIRKTLYKTFPAIIQACLEKGKTIRAYLLTAFCCQYEGRVPIKNIVELASKLVFWGLTKYHWSTHPAWPIPNRLKKPLLPCRI